jgi:hypothetical protein
MGTIFHGGTVAGSGALYPASADRGPYDRAAVPTYCATGDVDARGVYAFGADMRE